MRSNLCQFCSTIDFDYIRVPTAGQLRLLSSGHNVTGSKPFCHEPDKEPYPSWTLGSLARVRASARECPLCTAVAELAEKISSLSSNVLTPETVCKVICRWSGGFQAPAGAELSEELIRQMASKRTEDVSFSLNNLSIHFTTQPSNDFKLNLKSTKIVTWWIQAYNPGHAGETAVPFDDSHVADDSLLFCGRPTSPMVPMDLLLAWMRECKINHKYHCAAKVKPRRVDVFRLIDVKTKAVVRFTDVDVAEFRYVALSYVWGMAQRLSIRRENMMRLGAPGSLVGKVSKTIEDSISLTESLGVQYLWVDALCILQDDTSDKLNHLAFMSYIYKCAELTILAACGRDAEAGLPGIREPRVFQQHIIKVRDDTADQPLGMQIITSPTIRLNDVQSCLEGTVWSTRGWTLQEKVVSRRVLIFTPSQISWNCRTTGWAEDIFLETSLARPTNRIWEDTMRFLSDAERESAWNDDVNVAWDTLRMLVDNFSHRQLSEPGDAYDAFCAIAQEFQSLTHVSSIWALPVTRFELALCWTRTQGRLVRRTALTSLPMTTLKCCVAFPTWSWLGWIGGASLPITDQYADTGMSPEILCFILRNSPLRVVKVIQVTGDETEIPTPKLPPGISHSPLAVTLETVLAEHPHFTRERLQQTPDNQLLCFWTETACFSTYGPIEEVNDTWPESKFFRYEIRNSESQTIGRTDLCVPDNPEDMTCILGEGVLEFVLIARNATQAHVAEELVLMVVRRDGIANRVTTANILEEAWIAANTKKELLVLG
ncbi:HET-domain-containing protein [Stipitochalara longipes BDJ]|nr:HET-domain-containing protein [Stipitochalara longipes BDJ]